MIKVSEIFKIGIGPSSSHTVGPMVAANRFLALIGDNIGAVHSLQIELYGSLAATGKGHATDTAILLGLLGHTPRHIDTRLSQSYLAPIYDKHQLHLGGQKTVNFDPSVDIIWHEVSLSYHPNAMTLSATYPSGERHSETYYSIGGGFVVDSSELSQPKQVMQTDITPPYPFDRADTLLKLCQDNQLSISELVLANECYVGTKEALFGYLDDIWAVMQDCVDNGCANDGILPGGLLVKRRAKALHQSLKKEWDNPQGSGGLLAMDWVNLYALAVNEENAGGGKVVTAPTNGAAGIVPAVLHYYRDFIDNFSVDGVYQFLLTAAAIGMLIKENASISGAEVGCQGEVGSACAMAAAGLCEVLGGTPAQVINAAEIGLEHNLGLTCDPIAGLVQVPCIERNAIASVKAINAARLALRGDGEHLVSLDRAILTMKQTGEDMLDKYKETARGGLAVYAIDKGRIDTLNVVQTVQFSQC